MTDEAYMRLALSEAVKAGNKDEVPVGAVIVSDAGKVLARGRNRRERLQDATAHAETEAIRRACKKLRSWRLSGCTLYVTLEPCPMCAGAAVNARLSRIVFGAYDEKGGACGTKHNVSGDSGMNHNASARGGVLETECRELLTRYFRDKRRAGKSGKPEK